MHIFGIGFALLALICWGFGDFLIQKTSRDYGIWPSLFCITFLASIILFPFAIKDFPTLVENLPLIIIAGIVTTLASVLEFTALRVGKISIVEPIISFELPFTVLLGVLMLGEHVTSIQSVLILLVFGSILLLGYTGEFRSKHLLEKGALLALIATVLVSFMNFTIGLSSQNVGPIAAIWSIHVLVTIICAVRFTITKSWHHVWHEFRKHPGETLGVAIFDNGAWLAYSAAVIYIPISLAITLSEGYIILAILLGVIINRERLLKHQWVGVIIAIGSVLMLASIS